MTPTTQSMAVFDRVARREISAEEGANQLLAADRERERPLLPRPRWAPAWAWGAAAAAVALLLSLVGLDLKRSS